MTSAAIAALGTLGAGGIGLLTFAWRASSASLRHEPSTYAWDLSDYPELEPKAVTVESPTGARLAGRFFPGRDRATVVLLHGFGGTQDEMLPLAASLHDAGLSVFTYDQRGCGASSGELTFGAREQDDLIAVVEYLARRPDVDAARIGGAGFSMGAATLLMTAVRESRLRVLLADSAWATALRWLRPSLKASFLHPRDRFSSAALALVQLRTGIRLDVLRPCDAVASLTARPLLLVHGDADTVVLPDDAATNYEAAADPKELVIVPGAHHCATIAPGGATVRRAPGFFRDRLATARSAAA